MEYPDLSALPTELQEAVTTRGSVNVYRMITHSPGLAPASWRWPTRCSGATRCRTNCVSS